MSDDRDGFYETIGRIAVIGTIITLIIGFLMVICTVLNAIFGVVFGESRKWIGWILVLCFLAWVGAYSEYQQRHPVPPVASVSATSQVPHPMDFSGDWIGFLSQSTDGRKSGYKFVLSIRPGPYGGYQGNSLIVSEVYGDSAWANISLSARNAPGNALEVVEGRVVEQGPRPSNWYIKNYRLQYDHGELRGQWVSGDRSGRGEIILNRAPAE